MPYDEKELRRIQEEEEEYARKAEERKKKRKVQSTLGLPAVPSASMSNLPVATVSRLPAMAPVSRLPANIPPAFVVRAPGNIPEKSETSMTAAASSTTHTAHIPWYLAAARQNMECQQQTKGEEINAEQHSSSAKLDWAQCIAFAGRVDGTPGIRNSQRPSYLKCLQDLCAYVLSWQKDKRVKPLHLVGEIGCGKSALLSALADHCKLTVQFLQEVFLDPPTHDVLEQLCSQGLDRQSKLWVIEHFDTLTPQWRHALKSKGFSNMLKSGCVIMTSWPSSKQPAPNTLELTPWTTETKIKFLKTLEPHLSLKEIAYLLGESGDCMHGALEGAKMWGTSLGAQVLASMPSEDSEYCPPPPVNIRLLLEESFTDRWSSARSLALDTCDNELSLDLLQELSTGAAFQGRCDISSLAQQLDTLSHLDLASRKCPEVIKAVMCQRLVQKQTLKNSRVSMSKFSSGTLIPLPQSLLNLGRARTSAKSMDDLVLESRDVSQETTEHLRDTCKNLDDVQLFAQASGRKWISPFKTK
jgi:tRNA A37 threonylcarbamoyladenosine biosynthesis protein TsaE